MTKDTVEITLDEVDDLCQSVFLSNGCDQANADALTKTIVSAERDGSVSHGLFRIPGYVASLRSGKVNGRASPVVRNKTPGIVSVHGDNGYAPLALERGIPALIESGKSVGIAAMAITHSHHFAALWPEVEALAEHGLVGFACVSYKPSVAPFGAKSALFGTNPIAFAWPRPNKPPFVFDMATASMAMGEVMIAKREGHSVPVGTGLDADGNETTDPAKIAQGVLLPFGGYKGSAIAAMVELLAAGAIGERFSFEAQEADNNDGGPPRGGHFMFALSPEILSDGDWQSHSEGFFERFESLEGARLPGTRRHRNRQSSAARTVNLELLKKIRQLDC